MKIELVKFKRFWAVLALVGILTIFGSGSILLKNGIGVFAQDGDFVGDLTSELSLKKREDDAEKTSFLSGEGIEYDSRIEVSGKTASYQSPYIIYKMPSEYLDSSRVTSPDLVGGAESYDEGGFKVWKVKLNDLSGGSVVGTLIRASLKNVDTPEGYKFEIIQEVYSNNSTLLSRRSKTVDTLKQKRSLELVRKGVNIDNRYNWLDTPKVSVATYTDSTNTTIDQDSWSKLGVVKYGIEYRSSQTRVLYGRSRFKHHKITDFLPRDMELTEESVNDGWVYDQASHSATKIVPSIHHWSSSEYGNGLVEIYLRFKKGTSPGILNTAITNRARIEMEYEDGGIIGRDVSSDIIPVAIVKTGDVYDFYKDPADAPWGADFRWSNGRKVYNINTIDTLNWDIKLLVRNNGQDRFAFDKIVDHFPDHLKVSWVTARASGYIFPENDPLELYGTNSSSEEKKLGDLFGSQQIFINSADDIRSIRLSTKSGSVPGFLNGQDQYFIIISVGAKVNKEYLKTLAMERDVEYKVSNTATVFAGGDEMSSAGDNLVGRWGIKLNNSLALNNKPWYSNGAAYRTDDRLTTGYNNWHHLGRSIYGKLDLNKVDGAKVVYIFPKEMDFTDEVQDKIKNGVWKYYYDYKNTGKSAMVQSGDFSNVDFLTVGRMMPSGTHEIEKVTIWSQQSEDYGDGPDDLDFHDDGDTTTRQVARSKGAFVVENPLFVGTFKQVRSLEKEDFFSESIKIKSGDRIEYRISVINYDRRALNGVRSLEILPYAGDKLIVRNNFGDLADRGSNTAVKMTGPVVDLSGKFNVFYSTEAPGANEDESYAKNFVPADQITDWSVVRMIKFEQKADQEISAQSTVSLTFPAKVDQNAPDQSVAVNTFATGLSGTSKLNEGNAAKLTVIRDAKVRGIAFEDMNSNGVFDRGVDALLSGYKVKLMKGDQVIAEKITGDNGEYEITTDKFADGYKIQFEKPAGEIRNIIESQMNNGFENSNASNIENKETLNSFIFNLRENGEKEVVRNIGLFTPRGSVRVKFQTIDGIELKADQIPFENRPVGERYSTEFLRNQNRELADANGLRYQFSKRKEDSAQETGLIEPGEKTVVYQYEPMAGSIVTVKYVIRGTQTELAPQVVVKPQGTQVGTPFTAPYKQELIDANGLVYYQPTFSGGHGPSGRVSDIPINLVASYQLKPGGNVEYSYETEDGSRIVAPILIRERAQVGSVYSHTPDLEVEYNGITHILKGLKDGSAPQNGTIKTEDQLITYVFVPKKGGQVVANYFDEEGNSISNTSIVSATDTPVGTDYQNTPPAEIANTDGLRFTYKELGANSAPRNGKVKAETQEIRYIYAKKLGKGVISKFIDEDGNEISPDVEVVADGAQVGTRYSAAHQNEITKDNLVFEFKEIAQNSAPENGKTTEDSQVVTFVYCKKLGGKVTAKFVDLDGNELKDSIEVAPEGQQVGTEYSSTKENEIEKDGLVYVFEVLVQNSAPENGRIKSDAQEVIYAYAPKKGGSVTAKFLDKNGVEIQIPGVIKPRGTQVGTPYESTSKDKIKINDKTYILREVKGEQTGKVSDSDIVIEYIFELEEKPAAILAPNTGFMAGVGGLLAVIVASVASFFVLKKKSRI